MGADANCAVINYANLRWIIQQAHDCRWLCYLSEPVQYVIKTNNRDQPYQQRNPQASLARERTKETETARGVGPRDYRIKVSSVQCAEEIELGRRLANIRVLRGGNRGGACRQAKRFRLLWNRQTERCLSQGPPTPGQSPRGGPRDSLGRCFHQVVRCTP